MAKNIQQKVLERSDVFVAALASLGFAILSGIMTAFTLFPDASGGGFSITDVLINLGGSTASAAVLSVTWAVLFAVLGPVVMYGTNRILSELFGDGEIDLQDTETIAFAVAVLLPLIHETVQAVHDAVAGSGSVLMQVLAFVVYVVAILLIAGKPYYWNN
jgi:hypothetical protein